MKSKKVAYLLWVVSIFGCLGLHRFYLWKIKTGILWLCTGGLVGIGSLLDLFSLGEQVRQVNNFIILGRLAQGEDIEKLKKLFEQNNLQTNIHCPYCRGNLTHKPKRKAKCPICLSEIHIRNNQRIFENDLLTKEEAIIIDYLKKLAKFGIQEDDFIEKRSELIQSFGDEIVSLDVMWNLIQQAILNIKDLNLLNDLYQRTALLLEDLNQDFHYVLQRAAKMQLVEYRKDGYTKQVRIVSAGSDICLACHQLESKIFTIEEALQLIPVPCKECTHLLTKKVTGFCRCGYQAEDY